MAAARATLAEVLTEQTYAKLDRLALSLQEYMEKVVRDAGVQWNVVSVGAKGCVTFRPERVRDFRDFLDIDDRYSHAHWLVQHNGGVFLPPWGKVEQWLLSAQHDEADIDLFARNFSDFVAAVTS
jgi:glutamate-1-semialdehyde 2,1-aminomutase